MTAENARHDRWHLTSCTPNRNSTRLGDNMRRLVLSTVAAAIAATPFATHAADMAPITKAPAAVPYYNWTGFYAGVNAGYSVARDRSTYDSVALPFPGQQTGEFY